MTTDLKALLPKEELENYSEKQIRILESAIEVFAEKGYAGASTNEIAKKANVAEGTIFRYYKTKKELLMSISFMTLMKIIGPFLLKQFKKEVFEKKYNSFYDFVKFALTNRYEFSKKNLPILKILIQEISLHKEIKEQFVKMFVKEVYPTTENLINHYKEKGEIIDEPTPVILRFILTNAIGLIISNLIINSNSINEDEDINKTVDLIVKGLKKEKGK